MLDAVAAPQWMTSVDSAQAMRQLAARLASWLQPGDALLLEGELGAGKTTFAQGIGVGLGVADEITSPTFILLCEYAGRVRLRHMDGYRLRGQRSAIDALDWDADREEVVLLVEWGDDILSELEDAVIIRIARIDSGEWQDCAADGTAADAQPRLLSVFSTGWRSELLVERWRQI